MKRFTLPFLIIAVSAYLKEIQLAFRAVMVYGKMRALNLYLMNVRCVEEIIQPVLIVMGILMALQL